MISDDDSINWIEILKEIHGNYDLKQVGNMGRSVFSKKIQRVPRSSGNLTHLTHNTAWEQYYLPVTLVD